MSDFSQYDEQVVVIFNVPGKSLEPLYFDNIDELNSFLLTISKTLGENVYYRVYRVFKPYSDYINVAVAIMDVRDRSIGYFNSYNCSLVRSSSGLNDFIPSTDLYIDHLEEDALDLKIGKGSYLSYGLIVQRLEFPYIKLFWGNALDITDAYPILKGMVSAEYFSNAFLMHAAKHGVWLTDMFEQPRELNMYHSFVGYVSSKGADYHDSIQQQISKFIAPFKKNALIGDQTTLNVDPNHQVILETVPLDVLEDVETEEDYDVPEEMEAI